jgi:pyridinium-3,5-biscarboxylic acid mononucleotide sulfurtransferase
MTTTLTDKVLSGEDAFSYTRLRAELDKHSRLVVAFSGGADSALLAYAATAVLGPEHVLCATAISPSLAEDDRRETEALATEWGLRYHPVNTDELENPDYQANGLDRCYFCKAALMDALGPIAERESAAIALGVNVDDLGDYRPGQAAAREAGAIFPLLDAGLTKVAVRSLSKALGLRTWDKPANACLSSRIPQGTPVTIGLLSKVDRAEQALRQLGFRELRARHYGDTCRIELADDEFDQALASRAEIVQQLRAVGYRYVTLDLESLRSGNLVRTALDSARRD